MMGMDDIVEFLANTDSAPQSLPFILASAQVLAEIVADTPEGEGARSQMRGQKDLTLVSSLAAVTLGTMVAGGTWEEIDWKTLLPMKGKVGELLAMQLSTLKGPVPEDSGARAVAIQGAMMKVSLRSLPKLFQMRSSKDASSDSDDGNSAPSNSGSRRRGLFR